MTEANIRDFHASFDRCMAQSGRFLDVFYDHFLKSSAEVTAKFQGTDFKRQKVVLRLTLIKMVGALVLHSADCSELKDTAISHSRNDRDIPPHLYSIWLDSLIFAAKTCDAHFDPEAEQNWRDAMQPGIDYIISQY